MVCVTQIRLFLNPFQMAVFKVRGNKTRIQVNWIIRSMSFQFSNLRTVALNDGNLKFFGITLTHFEKMFLNNLYCFLFGLYTIHNRDYFQVNQIVTTVIFCFVVGGCLIGGCIIVMIIGGQLDFAPTDDPRDASFLFQRITVIYSERCLLPKAFSPNLRRSNFSRSRNSFKQPF